MRSPWDRLQDYSDAQLCAELKATLSPDFGSEKQRADTARQITLVLDARRRAREQASNPLGWYDPQDFSALEGEAQAADRDAAYLDALGTREVRFWDHLDPPTDREERIRGRD